MTRRKLMTLHALALNCTLKSGGQASSTDRLLTEVIVEPARHGVTGEVIRVANLDVKPGVTSDEGQGDEWPALRRRVPAADILVLGTPIWLG